MDDKTAAAGRRRIAELLSGLSPDALIKLLYFALGLSAARGESDADADA